MRACAVTMASGAATAAACPITTRPSTSRRRAEHAQRSEEDHAGDRVVAHAGRLAFQLLEADVGIEDPVVDAARLGANAPAGCVVEGLGTKLQHPIGSVLHRESHAQQVAVLVLERRGDLYAVAVTTNRRPALQPDRVARMRLEKELGRRR